MFWVQLLLQRKGGRKEGTEEIYKNVFDTAYLNSQLIAERLETAMKDNVTSAQVIIMALTKDQRADYASIAHLFFQD